MAKVNIDDLFPAKLAGASGYGKAEAKEVHGNVQATGQFVYNTIDFATLKEIYELGRRCEYQGLWVSDGEDYIATVEVAIAEMDQRSSSLTFRAISAPRELRKL
jgi:hypothetical protein